MSAPDDEAPASGNRFQVRPLVTSDLPAVFRIEADSYTPGLRESEAAILAKMALFRAGALGCFDGGEMCGYAFAVPWRAGTVIGIAQVLDGLPDNPDVMYIHDMVVAPARRQQGVASTLLGEIVRVAAALHLDRFSLVAVQGSEPFWQRSGFAGAGTFEYAPGVRATRMEMSRSTRQLRLRSNPSNIPK